MTTNRLAKPAESSTHRNPLTDPQVAREWAATARAAGKRDLADQWEAKARELDGNARTRADLD